MNQRASKIGIFFGISLLLLGVGLSAWAQAGRGAISGLVSDSSGAVVPGAAVTTTNSATGSKLSTVTTGDGLYSFISLAPGTYEVTATARGFETVVHQHVSVTVDQVTTVNLALPVGAVNQVVTVSASSELADTTNSTVGQLIASESIDRVPLLTRNVYDLVQLSAGVTPRMERRTHPVRMRCRTSPAAGPASTYLLTR